MTAHGRVLPILNNPITEDHSTCPSARRRRVLFVCRGRPKRCSSHRKLAAF